MGGFQLSQVGGVLPITGLRFLETLNKSNGEIESLLLFVGTGSTVKLYDVFTGTLLLSQRVLYGSCIHGIETMTMPGSNTTKVVVFGLKSCKLVELSSDKTKLKLGIDFGEFLDRILDVKFLDCSNALKENPETVSPLLAISFAQGFVEIMDLESGKCIKKVFSQAHRILYSSAFRPLMSDESLWLASGTVFGELVLWTPQDSVSGEVKHSIKAHTGAVFCVRWSSDGNSICSAGDDRRFILWRKGASDDMSSFKQVYTRFAHNSRIWDCQFWGNGVITSGEDTEVRIWDSEGECLSVLYGHFGKNIWCSDVSRNRLLVTGGSDGDIKLWDLFRETKTDLNVNTMKCLPGSEAKGKGSDEIVALSLLPDDKLLVLATSGTLWITSELNHKEWQWETLIQIPKGEFKKLAVCEKYNYCIIGSLDGTCYLLNLRNKKLELKWKGHKHRIVLASLWYDEDGELQAFTSSVDSRLVWWKLTSEMSIKANPAVISKFSGNAGDPKPGQIISMCVHDNLVGIFGDIRGKLHIYDLRRDRLKEEGLVLTGVHGKDKVSVLISKDGKVYSGGHNGVVLEHLIERDQNDEVYLRTVRSFGCGPVMSIFYIQWTQSGSMLVGGYAFSDFYLFDASNQYLLIRQPCGGWRRPTTLMVSDSALPHKKILFAYCPPVKETSKIPSVGFSFRKLDNALQFSRYSLGNASHGRTIWSTKWLNDEYLLTGCENGLLKVHRFIKNDVGVQSHTSNIPLANLGSDRSQWTKHYLTEEHCMPNNSGSLETLFSLHGHGGAIRSIWRHKIDSSNFLIVSGGGMQILRCWLISTEIKSSDNLPHSELLCENAPVFAHNDHTQRILSVCIVPMDKRPQAVGEDTPVNQECYLILSADSNGDISMHTLRRKLFPGAPLRNEKASEEELDNGVDLSKLSKKARKKEELRRIRKQSRSDKLIHTGRHSCRVSQNADMKFVGKLKNGPDKPVLCLAHTSKSKGLVCSGSTDGTINAWRIATTFDGDINAAELEGPKRTHVLCEKLHKMGVDAISIATRETGSVIVSGGDDQAIGVIFLDTNDIIQSKMLFPESCGSAIRGIQTDGYKIWSTGLNQRLRVWELSSNENEDQSELELCLKFSLPVDPADVNSLDVMNDNVVISGAGFSVFSE